ncbi:MAG: endonuclease/exonuclease/phosphatase family protein [Bacteroidales bacterium]|nr:endonuclease/exonuclease/phosphatase family protein [Bacteroidales bacterium]MBN2819042.1 endonuclease/exonuclease/phosphatase family protein [Bacteroidales bacterium]
MKNIFRIFLVIVLIPVSYLVIIILFGTITNYKPEPIENISRIEGDFYLEDTGKVYTAAIWNIGYAGLGANMDFFYDGGEKVRDTKENVRTNLNYITQWVRIIDTIDFILLQEVDEKSKRSYRMNQLEEINLSMAQHFPFFAYNYNVKMVPLPFLRPMGKVKSGLLSLTMHVPQQTDRYSFPGNYSWPKSTFMLDRFFLVNRFKLMNGKEFVLVNTHNSAYDDGSLRAEQMGYLKIFLNEEQKNGNYVLVGGDWNQCPPSFKDNFTGHVFDTSNVSYVPENYLDNSWQWIYDNSEPTNRRVMTPYTKGKCPVTLIDFFLASGNIEVLNCQTVPMNFKFSDHQPVVISFRFK